jgi:hypothetical protein
MWNEFAKGVGGKLADRWVATVLAPAFAFWTAGLAAIAWHTDDAWWGVGLSSLIPGHEGWRIFHVDLPDPDTLRTQQLILLLLGGLLLVTSLGALAQSLVLPTLRFCEGYNWPKWLSRLHNRLVKRQVSKAQRIRERINAILVTTYDGMPADERRQAELAESFDDLDVRGKHNAMRRIGARYLIENETYDPVRLKEYNRLDMLLDYFPKKERMMPTRLGNILKKAEVSSREKYGLNMVATWDRLWLVVSDGVRNEVNSTRAVLDEKVLVFIWSLLIVLWGFWLWWMPIISVIGAIVTYRAIIHAAMAYGDRIEALYDVQRLALYQAVRWPLPQNPIEEIAAGRALSRYFLRAARTTLPRFVDPNKKADATPPAAADESVHVDGPGGTQTQSAIM